MEFMLCSFQFLPTPSARRATDQVRFLSSHVSISTHALREEGDSKRWNSCCAPFNFYPRPPRGGRQTRFDFYHPMLAFLPTPSARRATTRGRGRPRGRGHFYPRPPRGGRPMTVDSSGTTAGFLPTPSARRATRRPPVLPHSSLFLPTPSARRATCTSTPPPT